MSKTPLRERLRTITLPDDDPTGRAPRVRPRTLQEAVALFLDDLAVGRSPRTVRSYGSALKAFVAFVGEDTPVEHLSPSAPVDFVRAMRVARGDALTYAMVGVYSSSVMGLYKWLDAEEIVLLPIHRIQARLSALRGRKPKRLPRVPSDEAVAAIVAAARRRPPGRSPRLELARLRDIALVEVLRTGGLRVAEVVGLRRGDLDPETGTVRVRGKGGKDRVALLGAEAWEALAAYLTARDGNARAVATRPVFSHHDKAHHDIAPLTTNAVRQIVARLAEEAGVEEPVTPHRLRAWFATTLVERTGNLAAVQDLLGHQSADTTRIYAKMRQGHLQALHARAFARLNGLNGKG
jgi:site-specific recombinase XerD